MLRSTQFLRNLFLLKKCQIFGFHYQEFYEILSSFQTCLIRIPRFYEWQGQGSKKQPYYLQLRNDVTPHVQTGDNESKQLLTFAGLFDKQISDEVISQFKVSNFLLASVKYWISFRLSPSNFKSCTFLTLLTEASKAHSLYSRNVRQHSQPMKW